MARGGTASQNGMPPGVRPLTVGDPVVIGHYLLLGRLGSGGMGVVYLAEHPRGGYVALKTPHPVHLGDPTLRARFAEEVAFSRRVVPFCTAAVIEDGLDGERPYLVTEYVPGPALSQVVAAGGPLTPDLAYGVALGTAAALLATHEAGLVHRDLKPGNVLLSPRGPFVIDFGIARDLDVAMAHTQAGQIMGSPGWVAPERLRGHHKTLNAARLAADVAGVPSLVIARTDAQAATLLTSDVDPRDRAFCTGDRTAEGFYRVRNGVDACIARGLAYAPYADLLWMETSTPDLDVAREFAEAIRREYPDQMLAYNCSPSFNWKKHLDDATIAKFQRELGHMGYKFQFITLAGFHSLNYSMFDLARGYAQEGMTAYVGLQEAEFAAEQRGYTATRHQREVGTGYFDLVSTAVAPDSSTTALKGSTEEAQFAGAH
ncbi:isocitrate lyase [Microbispora sp. NEAU-D428]|uniref:isocitrate lyase n=1 Tax=Microbispora sitophila TaxID=2771537 RepID=UPI001866AD34|nr:isocitrate lyase [Microbispora sitophila]MBE3011040.1 isocitrate lyase [Microbispora sitophila]